MRNAAISAVDRSSTRRVTCATTCATVRVAGTSFERNRDVEPIFELGDHLEDLQRIESEIGDEIAVERRLDRPPARLLEHVDHAFFNLHRKPAGLAQ